MNQETPTMPDVRLTPPAATKPRPNVRCLPPSPGQPGCLRFACHGVPPTVTAQQKGACATRGRRAVKFFTKPEVLEAKATLKRWLFPHRPAAPLTGALIVRLVTVFPWRESESQRNRLAGFIPHGVRPDVDNLAKLTLDVMTDLGFWADDGQVAFLRLSKFWGDLPGLRIDVRRFADGPEYAEADVRLAELI